MSARTAAVASARHGRLSLQALSAIALAVAIFAVDTFTPLGSAVAVIYGIVIMLAGTALSGRNLVLAATACAGLTVFSYLATHTLDVQDSAFLRCIVSLCAIAATTFLVLRSRRAEEALLQAQADLARASRLTMLGQFTATIAHEVNQPLGAIATNGEAALRFLDRAEPDLAEVRSALARIIQGSKRASDVVARIRSHLAKSTPERLPVDLPELIEEAALLVQRELQSRRVDLRIDVAPRLPPVLGDRVQLQQVIINLLVNGAQAMAGIDGPRRLVVRADPGEDRHIRVQVRDTGMGIADEDMHRLFGTFFTTKPDGMGLGLAICRSIVEAHGGRIEATQPDTPGALIEFTLPVADQIRP